MGWCALIAVVGFAARAGAQTADETAEPTLGAQGHWALSLERAFGFDYSKQTSSLDGVDQGTSSATSFSLLGNPTVTSLSVFTIPRVGFDAFVAPGLSIGAAFGIDHGSIDDTPAGGGTTTSESFTAVLFAPRVGYVAHLAPAISFWPRAGVSVFYASIDPGAGLPSESLKLIAATVDAPLVFTLVPRVAFTFGPTFDITFSGNISASGGAGTIDVSVLEIGVQAGLVVTL
jgi:hypothetical protein